MSAVFRYLSGCRVVDLPEPWYKLALAGRKRVLCLADGPGISTLFWRHYITVRLRDSTSERAASLEQFEAYVCSFRHHASIRALLREQGSDVLPGVLPEEAPGRLPESLLEEATALQNRMLNETELEHIRAWGVISLRIIPTDPIGSSFTRRPRRKARMTWYARLSDE